MSRILFVSVDAGGNLPPALALARTLAARGHQIVIAGSPAQRARTGDLAFHALPALAGWPDPTRPAGAPAIVRKYVWLAASRRVAGDVAAAIREHAADVVVVDCMMLSAVRAAEASGARTVVLFHSLLSFWNGPWRRGPVGGLARLFGADAGRVWAVADARLVTTARELDDASLADTHWIGTTESGEPSQPEEPPLVLVSFSSMHIPGQLAAYRNVIAALGGQPVRGIVTMGAGGLEEVAAPPNVELRGFADHGELMRRASLVITHGGHSTTLKALAHGVPVLVVPMHPALDQSLVGAAVARRGAGLVLPRTSSPERFAAAIRELRENPAFTEAARALGERLRATDAAQSAADVILGELPHRQVLTPS
jgi:UDP:flavonoid glycosyltransferase YjiC (YdhE family)